MDSFSESDFTDSSSDVDDSSCAREKVVADVNATSTAVKCTPADNVMSRVSHVDVGSRTMSSSEQYFALQDSQLEPAVGMVFHSEEEAYNFYNAYAKRKGFSVRKGHISRRSDGTIRSRSFLCSNEGTREKHHSHITRKPRAIERTNCMARIEYKVDSNVWVVSKVILEHNHLLTSPSQAHMLRSQRKMLRAQHGVPDEVGNVGTETYQSSDCHAGEMQNTETIVFPLKYQTSCLHSKRTRDLDKGEAQILLDFLKAKQSEDPSFFYAIQLDEMERLTNFFWVDVQSVVDYTCFGDVVSFDTTYRVNKCDTPFAPFIGLNHHKQIVIFGAALLLDETEESFVWLLKTFLFAMSGRQPRTIFTDHCAALSQAIGVVLPNTSHRLCLWHIYQNSLKNLASLYNNQPNFQKEFKICIYEGGSEEDFHAGWNNIVSRYDIAGNSWLQDLFMIREKWALVYNRNLFCASMITMQWSEGMSTLFKEHLCRRWPLPEFLQQYEKTLIRLREKELSEDFKSRHTKPVLLVDIPMLNEAAESYTRLIYADFEAEFKSQIACLCEPVAMDEKLYTFRVSRPGEHGCWVVEFDPLNITVTCSCKKFECMGILCMHALKVLNNNNILQLPSRYILKRWTKFANESVIGSDSQESLTLRYSQICHKAISFARKSAVSNDALGIFERGLDKLIAEIENMSNNTTVSTHAVEQGSQKGLSEGSHERKKKRKSQANCNPVEASTVQNTSQSSAKAEPSHVQPQHQKGPTSYYIPNPMQPGGVLRCTFFPSRTVQGNHIDASHGAKNPEVARSTTGSTIMVPMLAKQGQTNNVSNQGTQSCSVPNGVMSQHHLNQQMHSILPSQQQLLSHELNLNIHKGH